MIIPTPKRFIAIAGNIGVGKSTLTRLIASAFQWEPFFESAADNPYLPDFYRDMNRWSFHSQVFYLGKRLEHHRRLVDHPGSVLQDRTVYEDAEIFAHNLYDQGLMSARDYDSYRRLYHAVSSFLPAPDLIIYLRADVDTLLQRIRQRGNEYERTIAPDYLARLNDLYEDWITGWHTCPIRIIPAAEIDYVAHPEDIARIIDPIRELFSEIAI
ncbi:MAG: deoxynucleoside kinase [Chloroflexota bacterium]|nr:deoxynucleoside kinase [Chloroflexota bacterium]